jgi:hypothetical protein
MQLPVKCSAERTFVKHGQVAGIDPVSAFPQLLADGEVKLGSGERVGNRHADIIRQAIIHHLKGLLDILAGLPRIAKLEEEADLDPHVVQAPGRFVDLLYPGAFIHDVQDFLRA